MLVSVCVLARDITTLTGQIYRDVTVTRVEKTGIGILHRDGTAFLDFSILLSEIRKEFGYSETTYAAAKAAEAAQKQQLQLAIETQKRLAAEAKERQAEEQRRIAEMRAEAARIATDRTALRPFSPPAISIGTRDYASRGYADRNYRTSPYTPQSLTSDTTPRTSPSSSSGGGQCAATTKKGYRCSRSASSGSSYCFQHGG